MDPMADPIADLLAGFRRFREHWFVEHPELYARLAQGQNPHTMVVACCDSRVDPGMLTDCRPGDIFVVRNVANLVPPCIADGRHHGTSAALEFAVRGLKVQNVLVLGHSQCGGIRALVEGGGQDLMFVQPWMDIARSACKVAADRMQDKDPKERLRACEWAGIAQSLANLQTFPWVREGIEGGALRLHGWHFDLEEGVLWTYDAGSSRFRPLQSEPTDQRRASGGSDSASGRR
jgi:carbonic anhydrase